MYDYFKGEVIQQLSDGLIIEVNDIGYHVLTANPYRFHLGEPLQKIWLYHAISQDDERLFGFLTLEERHLFMELIKVSGIGPKSALSILSWDQPEELIQAIETGNTKLLTKFPGVGEKTAKRIILDLQGKLVLDPNQEKVEKEEDKEPVYLVELRSALESLGYSSKEINRVITKADFSQVKETSEAIKVALNFMTV